MRHTGSVPARLALAGLAVGLVLGPAGCSDPSRQSGTQATVQEADKQALQKSADVRKSRMGKPAKLPRSKGGAGD